MYVCMLRGKIVCLYTVRENIKLFLCSEFSRIKCGSIPRLQQVVECDSFPVGKSSVHCRECCLKKLIMEGTRGCPEYWSVCCCVQWDQFV